MKENIRNMKFDYYSILNILTEKINITKIDFGSKKPFTDTLFNENSHEIYTFFLHENEIVVVSYNKNNKALIFSILENGETNVRHTQSNISFKHMQTFYGEVLYVFEQMYKKYNIKEFVIFAAPFEKRVEQIYNTFSKNSHIQSIFKNMGFEYETYTHKDGGFLFKIHHFYKSKHVIQGKFL